MARASARYALLEGALLLVAILALPGISERFEHFTWWGLSLLAIYDIEVVIDRYFVLRTVEATWIAILCIHVYILINVMGMSILRCDLIRNAAEEVGPVKYIVGNYAMHYWTVNRLVSVHRTISEVELYRQILLGMAVGIVFFGLFRPTDIYGCAIPRELAVVSMFIVFAVVGVLINPTVSIRHEEKRERVVQRTYIRRRFDDFIA